MSLLDLIFGLLGLAFIVIMVLAIIWMLCFTLKDLGVCLTFNQRLAGLMPLLKSLEALL